MEAKIRGEMDESTRMILGQIRRIFDPDWIQGFDDLGFTVQFREEPEARDELINFADMYGFSLRSYEDATFKRFYFE